MNVAVLQLPTVPVELEQGATANVTALGPLIRTTPAPPFPPMPPGEAGPPGPPTTPPPPPPPVY